MGKNILLWETPAPSSGFVREVSLEFLVKRDCRLVFSYQAEGGDVIHQLVLVFINIAAFKCTYLPALTEDMIGSSYDKLIEVVGSEWLGAAKKSMKDSGFAFPVKHLRICFDDGPCYEFLCERFEV